MFFTSHLMCPLVEHLQRSPGGSGFESHPRHLFCFIILKMPPSQLHFLWLTFLFQCTQKII